MAEVKRNPEQITPYHCVNRNQNGFRCAKIEDGTPRTPNKNGEDCRECPRFVFTNEPERKLEQANRENIRGTWMYVIVMLFAITLLALIGIGVYALIAHFLLK